MHLEHLGDSLIRGGRRRWRVFVAGTRVSLGFTRPLEANGTNHLMPRSAVSKLRFGAPMNWGILRVLALSEIAVLNQWNIKLWCLRNEIGYFRHQHHCLVEFYVLSISLTSSELQPSEDRPSNALRAPWRLLSTGWPQKMDDLCGWNKGVTRVHPPPEANDIDDSMPRFTVSKLRCGAPMNWGTLRVLALSRIVVPNPNIMWSLKNEKVILGLSITFL